MTQLAPFSSLGLTKLLHCDPALLATHTLRKNKEVVRSLKLAPREKKVRVRYTNQSYLSLFLDVIAQGSDCIQC